MGLFDRIRFITKSYLNSFIRKKDDQQTYATAQWDDIPLIPEDVIKAYGRLGLAVDQSWKEVHATFIRLMKKNHPDCSKNLDKDTSTKITQELTEAYETIKTYLGK